MMSHLWLILDHESFVIGGSVETGNRKQETGNRKQETGNRKQETGNRKQETGKQSDPAPPGEDAMPDPGSGLSAVRSASERAAREGVDNDQFLTPWPDLA